MSSSFFSRQQPGPHTRLICFPFAGGGASAYAGWNLGPHIQVCPLLLPGREQRLMEPAYDRLEDLLADLVPAVIGLDDRPMVFFGHSMGAVLAFECQRALQARGHAGAEQVIVSAKSAPMYEDRPGDLLLLTDEELYPALEQRYGSPASKAERTLLVQMLPLLIPALRADLLLLDRYRFAPEPPISGRLSVLYGTEDHSLNAERCRAWFNLCDEPGRCFPLPGGHFTLVHQREETLRALRQLLPAASHKTAS